MSNITIRPYRPEDIPHMLTTIQQAFAVYKDQLDPPSSAERKTVAIMTQELQTAEALVAEENGRIIACIFYRPQEDSVYFDRLSVLPQHQGRGIASRLIAQVEQIARDQGAQSVTLSTRIALTSLHQYYQKQGYTFHAYGTHPGYDSPTYVILKKPLS